MFYPPHCRDPPCRPPARRPLPPHTHVALGPGISEDVTRSWRCEIKERRDGKTKGHFDCVSSHSGGGRAATCFDVGKKGAPIFSRVPALPDVTGAAHRTST